MNKPNSKVRANQLYRRYLNSRYDEEYYKLHHGEIIRKTKVFDFWIGLGTFVTGGTGLGILADPAFAYVCGVLTTASVIASVYKHSMRLDQEAKDCLERMAFFATQRANWERLVEDLQSERDWSTDIETRYQKVVASSTGMPPFAHSLMKLEKQRELQDQIKAKVNYEKFWAFER